MAQTLVTGATGFIGSHVTRLLVARGDEVVVAVRPRSDLGSLADLGLRSVEADVCDRHAVRRAMRGVERVFHLAGTTNLRLNRAQTFALNLEGTRIVLEEALRAGVDRLIYTSSAAAVGPAPEGDTSDESSVWDAGRYDIPYVDSKHEAEIVALRLLARGLPVVIVNPAHVLGAGDPGRSSTVLVDERGQVGERYILGNRNFTLDRLFADLGRLSGVEPPAVKLPLQVALALATAAEHAPSPPMPTPVEIRAASLNWAFANNKARRELGWRTSPHEDALEETIAWYREHDSAALAAPGSRQPLVLRVAGSVLRRAGLN